MQRLKQANVSYFEEHDQKKGSNFISVYPQ